ncbi:MAG: hypothetical protein JWN70_5751 [Planctomycetaceae bacterium]|nr:hypothetical protein [Planctomycetaceae bacterium]
MNLDQLRTEIQPLREALLAHPLYGDLKSPAALRTFMQYHVFAVWDFMSLLKALQQRLSCVTVPWIPTAHASGARLINEIVLGEETDSDGAEGFCSHFDLYLRSMTRFGASTAQIERFVQLLRARAGVSSAMQSAEVASPIQQFVNHTFQTIDGGNVCEIASAFTFGREDLLPGVFQCIVDELNQNVDGSLSDFQFYLQRHVELDGEEHGPLAAQLMTNLCGDSAANWQAATTAAVAALTARLAFWDGIHAAIRNG